MLTLEQEFELRALMQQCQGHSRDELIDLLIDLWKLHAEYKNITKQLLIKSLGGTENLGDSY